MFNQNLKFEKCSEYCCYDYIVFNNFRSILNMKILINFFSKIDDSLICEYVINSF